MIFTSWILLEEFIATEELDNKPNRIGIMGFLTFLSPLGRLLLNRKHSKRKYILYLNNYWNLHGFQFGEGHQPFLDAECPVSDCYATHDPTVLQGKHNYDYDEAAFDAVMIHAPEFNFHNVPMIQRWRRPEQRLVYMNMESPMSWNTPDIITMKNFFNWTMTYRHDSDIPRPYGFFQPISKLTNSNPQKYFPVQFDSRPQFLAFNEHEFLTKILPEKDQDFLKFADRPKKVAWIVSRCFSPSRREDYAARLKEYIDVDILGRCGNIPCDTSFAQHAYKDNCTRAVEKDYKFYLSFENSFCNDYVTEKFYKRLRGKSLPIVLGAAKYDQLAPPHSFLNALDYDSPKALAEKILELDKNNSQYLSYFWWKDHYVVHNGTASDHASSMCKLCEMLHDSSLPPKVYPSMSDWHGDKSQCLSELPRVIRNLLPNYGSSPDDGDDGAWPFNGLDDHF